MAHVPVELVPAGVVQHHAGHLLLGGGLRERSGHAQALEDQLLFGAGTPQDQVAVLHGPAQAACGQAEAGRLEVEEAVEDGPGQLGQEVGAPVELVAVALVLLEPQDAGGVGRGQRHRPRRHRHRTGQLEQRSQGVGVDQGDHVHRGTARLGVEVGDDLADRGPVR